MYTIEFETELENGLIKVPEVYQTDPNSVWEYLSAQLCLENNEVARSCYSCLFCLI